MNGGKNAPAGTRLADTGPVRRSGPSICAFLLTSDLVLSACKAVDTTDGTVAQATPAQHVSTQLPMATAKPKPTQAPVSTGQASFPVCDAKVTNAPCVQFASIQDAAEGESKIGAKVTTAMQGTTVWVHEDITDVGTSVFGPPTSLDEIQLQWFDVQQALW